MQRAHLILSGPILFGLVAAALLLGGPAHAERRGTLTYFEDPVYRALNDGDSHPMSDLIAMAEKGDTRAQFILGDLYAKGKGGLVRNEKKAAELFEKSAMAGYGPSYIRLAALAKHQGNYPLAWSWYDLGADYAEGRDARYAARARDQLNREVRLGDDGMQAARAHSAAYRAARSAALEKADAALREKRAAATAQEEKAEAASTPAGNNKKPHTSRTAGAKKEAAPAPEPKPAVQWRQTYND
jgi:hypothetical protein